jgi:glycosyltransferase involved in cell wall biosynthesis
MADSTIRILFVAFSDSIHTVRWINQINNIGWALHLFPAEISPSVHPDFRHVIVHHVNTNNDDLSVDHGNSDLGSVLKHKNAFKQKLKRSSLFQLSLMKKIISIHSSIKYKWWWQRELRRRVMRLTELVKELRPDIVHSLEIQHAGYLTQIVKKNMQQNFPPWIATNWGADIHYFGNLPEHAAKIRAVLGACDYYSCETQRDVQLAHDFGFKGRILPVLPNTGGFDFGKTEPLRRPGPTSDRRVILLKGPQGWVYRGLVGLRALALCADVLKEYTIAIYLASPEVAEAAMALSRETGIRVEIIPYCSHEEILGWHGIARISIGLAMSDGISTSFLEAIVMGSFPIQSNTGGAGDWIIDGEMGILVPPEDTEAIAKAIRRAMTDDELVNRAAVINEKMVRERLDYEHIRSQVIAMYKTLISDPVQATHG